MVHSTKKKSSSLCLSTLTTAKVQPTTLTATLRKSDMRPVSASCSQSLFISPLISPDSYTDYALLLGLAEYKGDTYS